MQVPRASPLPDIKEGTVFYSAKNLMKPELFCGKGARKDKEPVANPGYIEWDSRLCRLPQLGNEDGALWKISQNFLPKR